MSFTTGKDFIVIAGFTSGKDFTVISGADVIVSPAIQEYIGASLETSVPEPIFVEVNPTDFAFTDYVGSSVETNAQERISDVEILPALLEFIAEIHQTAVGHNVAVAPASLQFLAYKQSVEAPSFYYNPLTFQVVPNGDGSPATLFPFMPLKDNNESQEWITDVLQTRLPDASVVPNIKIKEFRYSPRSLPRMLYKHKYLFNDQKNFVTAKSLIDKHISEEFLAPLWNEVTLVAHIVENTASVRVNTADLSLAAKDFCIIFYSLTEYDIFYINNITATSLIFDNAIGKTCSVAFLAPLKRMHLQAHTFDRTPNSQNSMTCDFLGLETYSSYAVTVAAVAAASSMFDIFNDTLVVKIPIKMNGVLNENFARNSAKLDSETGTFLTLTNEGYSRLNATLSFLVKNQKELRLLKQILFFLKGRYSEFYIPSYYKDFVPQLSSLSSGVQVITSDKFYGWSVSPPRFIKIIGNYIHYAAVIDVQVVSGETETIAFTPALPSAMTNITQIQELLFVRSNTDNFDIEVTSREFSSLRAYCKIPIIEIPDNIPA